MPQYDCLLHSFQAGAYRDRKEIKNKFPEEVGVYQCIEEPRADSAAGRLAWRLARDYAETLTKKQLLHGYIHMNIIISVWRDDGSKAGDYSCMYSIDPIRAGRRPTKVEL